MTAPAQAAAPTARRWLLLTSRGQWDKFQRLGEWAFHEPSAAPASKIKPGDTAFVYLTQGRSNTELSAVAGLIEFRGELRRPSGTTVFDAFYPYRLSFQPHLVLEDPVPFAPLVPRLAFMTNKQNWSVHLRGKSVRLLADADADVLADAIGADTDIAPPQPPVEDSRQGQGRGGPRRPVKDREDMAAHRWSVLTTGQLGRYAEYYAKMEFTQAGCDVYSSEVDDKGIDFVIRTPAGRFFEVQVKSQLRGRYVYLRKEKFPLREHVFLALLLFEEARPPDAYLIPAVRWKRPDAMFKSRDFAGGKSKPEWGIELGAKHRPALEAFRFDRVVADLVRAPGSGPSGTP